VDREEALRQIVYDLDNDERYADEKYNSSRFLFGINNGVPDPEGHEWVCEVQTTYADVTDWKFAPAEEWLIDYWRDIAVESGDFFSEKDREAWTILGFDLAEAEA
jgi:hypothetical protein